MPKAAHCCWREPSAPLRTDSEGFRVTPGCRKTPVDSNGFESGHERDNLSSLDCACSLLHVFRSLTAGETRTLSPRRLSLAYQRDRAVYFAGGGTIISTSSVMSTSSPIITPPPS